MNDLAHIPEEKLQLLERIVARLRSIDGVKAVVLGGSYASRSHHAASDLDIGIYYTEDEPFPIDEIKKAAHEFSDASPAIVTGFYEWGAWVNGGAWLHTTHGKVDFLYRNLDHVRRTIEEACRGITQHDYDQQPTFGFYSVMYLAETNICLPLYDPQGMVTQLKEQVKKYPPALKTSIVKGSLWLAEFSLLYARDFAAKGDVYNTVGCITRVASNLTQALFALNERYFIRDKQVMETISTFTVKPAEYTARLQAILACPGGNSETLQTSVEALRTLWQEAAALAGELYQPAFR